MTPPAPSEVTTGGSLFAIVASGACDQTPPKFESNRWILRPFAVAFHTTNTPPTPSESSAGSVSSVVAVAVASRPGPSAPDAPTFWT